jgi:hypothetical protein
VSFLISQINPLAQTILSDIFCLFAELKKEKTHNALSMDAAKQRLGESDEASKTKVRTV